jgi:predicted nuclease with TOPRIM domain
MTNEEFQQLVLNEFGQIREEMSAVRGQLDENTQFIKALIHRTEELEAKYEGLLHVTASKEIVERIEIKIDILSHRILALDGEIQLLKKAR